MWQFPMGTITPDCTGRYIHVGYNGIMVQAVFLYLIRSQSFQQDILWWLTTMWTLLQTTFILSWYQCSQRVTAHTNRIMHNAIRSESSWSGLMNILVICKLCVILLIHLVEHFVVWFVLEEQVHTVVQLSCNVQELKNQLMST